MKKILKKIITMSLFKTFYFNFRYFGLKGLFVLPVLIGKKCELRKLGGKIIMKDFSTAAVQIAMNDMGNFPKSNTVASFQNSGTIIFEGRNHLGVGTRISNGGELIIGDAVTISADCSLICAKMIKIGKKCNISWGTQILDTDFHKIYDSNTKELLNPDKPVIIGEHCWISRGSLILKGVCLANDIIVAANSVITKSQEQSNTVIAMGGGKILKENVEWEM